MTKNPYLNALAAFVYIVVVVNAIDFGTRHGPNKSIVIPIAVLSLFTLSAGFMAYTFFFQPFQMYFGGKKKEAIELAAKSFISFGVITVVVVAVLFSGVIRY